jgi:hypothetical protein
MGYRAFTIALFMIALMLIPASGTQMETMDAAWWNALDEGNQITAVQAANEAYMKGYVDGAGAGSLALLDYAFKHLKGSQQSLVTSLSTYPFKAALAAEPYFPSTFGTYVHGISDFYANHPEALRATVGDIVSCLATRPHTDCDTIAKYAAKASQ